MFIENNKQETEYQKKVVEKYKNMDEDFEENYYSRTSRGVYKIGHESVRLM